MGWSKIQSQFLRKANLRLTDSHRSVILIVFYFISLGRVIEMWICWHYDLCLFTDNIVICAARWEFDDLSYGPKSLTKDRALIPELTLRSIISTHMIYMYISIQNGTLGHLALEASRMLTVDSKFDSKTPKSFWGKIDWSQTVAL